MQLDLFLREDAIVLAPTEDNPDIYTLGTIWKNVGNYKKVIPLYSWILIITTNEMI